MQSPCNKPLSSMRFISGWIPPISISSDIRYLPLGFTSANTGTRAPISVKSSSDNETPASRAMASKCSTALVEPPSAMTTEIEFSNALRVMMSSGLMSSRIRFMTAFPARWQSLTFCSDTASWAELFARLMPSASIADAIVFAVYIPPQAPGPGIAVCSTSKSSASSILPPDRAPTASNTETISRRFAPGLIVPP